MKRGIQSVGLPTDTVIGAPTSGVHLGVGESGPSSLRLFRLSGTSILVASSLAPAQLIAVRAVAAGTPVQVVTTRPQFWEPLLPTGRSRSFMVTPTEEVQPPGGPSLVIHDRPGQARAVQEIQPWQCRIDVRTEWMPQELNSFAYTDLALFGAVTPDVTRAIVGAFRVPMDQVERMTYLEAGHVAVLRRGALRFVAMDPSQAEMALIGGTRRPATPQPPVWR